MEDGYVLSISIHHPLDPQIEREFSGRRVIPLIGYEPVNVDGLAKTRAKELSNCREWHLQECTSPAEAEIEQIWKHLRTKLRVKVAVAEQLGEATNQGTSIYKWTEWRDTCGSAQD